MSKIVWLLLVFSQLSWQKDPLNDFCRRFGHQTTVVDSKLYIDGGAVDWNPISQNPYNVTNNWLLYNDLNTSPVGVGVPQLYANLSKNSSIPDVQGGILWGDEVNKRFYLYGGDYFTGNTPVTNLLSYDILYNNWDSLGAPGTGISSVSWGGGIGVSKLGQGYIYGGWQSNNSIPNWSGIPLATSYLVKYEMDTGVWTNNTGPDSMPRAEGSMVYIPASSNGLLVYFGGLEQPWANDTTLPSSMDIIYIYDIASSKWYIQAATGDVPADRRRFCAGAAWAPDQSSYNIYLYGGLGFGANATGFDDVYILSLPSFKWIKWWQGSGVGKPHHSLTCNIVNEGQMLIIGGTFPLSEDCDSPSTWGTHNLDLGKQSGRQWVDYQLNTTAYVVPPEIISVVGGSSLGGATATAPANGFYNADLGVYFVQQATVASRTPTRSIPTPTAANTTTAAPTVSSPAGKHRILSTGAIIGIAVAGGVVLLAILIGACCLIRRRPPPPSNLQNGAPLYPQSQNSHPAEYRYQLQANSIPAELSGVNEAEYQQSPKNAIMHRVDEHNHPVYHNARWVEINPPSPSPIGISPRGDYGTVGYSSVTDMRTMSPAHSSVHSNGGGGMSPVPTYSSVGRSSRRGPVVHDTYYSA